MKQKTKTTHKLPEIKKVYVLLWMRTRPVNGELKIDHIMSCDPALPFDAAIKAIISLPNNEWKLENYMIVDLKPEFWCP